MEKGGTLLSRYLCSPKSTVHRTTSNYLIMMNTTTYFPNLIKRSLRHLCRGPTNTLVFTIVRFDTDDLYTTYNNIIDVDNVVQLSVRFAYINSKYLPCMRMKKRDSAQNSAVPITLQCDTFNQLFFCSAEWIEVQLHPVAHTSVGTEKLPCNINYSNTTHEVNATCFTIQINATIQVITPTGFSNKELYEDTETTDFQLHTKDGTVDVHKAILFLHSNMFKLMLTREWKESNEGRISMDNITVQTLRDLKAYMYLGTLPDEGLEPLLQVGAHYFMDKLKADCSAKIVESVNLENIDRLIALACEFNIPELVRGLLFRVPNSVLNSMSSLKINDDYKESNDNVETN